MRSLFLATCLLAVCSLPVGGVAHASAGHRLTSGEIVQRVAQVYGEAHPRVLHLERTTTDSLPHQAMYVVSLSGHFRKGAKRARYLFFSALATRWYVWGVVGLNQAHQLVWNDPLLPHRSR